MLAIFINVLRKIHWLYKFDRLLISRWNYYYRYYYQYYRLRSQYIEVWELSLMRIGDIGSRCDKSLLLRRSSSDLLVWMTHRNLWWIPRAEFITRRRSSDSCCHYNSRLQDRCKKDYVLVKRKVFFLNFFIFTIDNRKNV